MTEFLSTNAYMIRGDFLSARNGAGKVFTLSCQDDTIPKNLVYGRTLYKIAILLLEESLLSICTTLWVD